MSEQDTVYKATEDPWEEKDDGNYSLLYGACTLAAFYIAYKSGVFTNRPQQSREPDRQIGTPAHTVSDALPLQEAHMVDPKTGSNVTITWGEPSTPEPDDPDVHTSDAVNAAADLLRRYPVQGCVVWDYYVHAYQNHREKRDPGQNAGLVLEERGYYFRDMGVFTPPNRELYVNHIPAVLILETGTETGTLTMGTGGCIMQENGSVLRGFSSRDTTHPQRKVDLPPDSQAVIFPVCIWGDTLAQKPFSGSETVFPINR